MEIINILQKIGEVLSKFKEIEIGYMFGSFLKGEFKDIDIALVLSKSLPPYDAMKFALNIEWELEKALRHEFEFDVKILNSAPIYFQYEVIKNGKPFFCRDKVKKIRYEAKVLSEYLDYKDTLDWFNRKLLARI